MSDTTEQQPPEEATGGAPAPSDAAPEAQQHPEPETPPAPAEEAQKERESRLDRRIAEMRARLSNSERQRHEMAQRLELLEAHARATTPAQPPQDPQVQAAVHAEAAKLTAEKLFEQKKAAFHAAGREAYPDWEQRMSELQGLGAVPISSMFLDIPSGHKVAAALRDNPEALEEILAQPTQEARGIALGKYMQQISTAPTRNVSRAPAPPKPIQGRVSTVFDPYAENNTTDRLVDFFSKQAMDAQLAQRRNGGQR